MAKSKRRSVKKITGGKYRAFRKKKLRDLVGVSNLAVIGEKRVRQKRGRGGNYRTALLSHNYVNVYVPSQKKNMKLKIEDVVENKANKNFERSNIITKGAVVRTEQGNVRITSRPGQHGVLNGVLE